MSYLGFSEDSEQPPKKRQKSISSFSGDDSSGNLELSKTATLRSDGDYDLKLTLKGTSSVSSSTRNMDFLIIIDRSNSMVVNEAITETSGRLTALLPQALNLVDALNTNPGIDAQFRIMEFSGSGHPREVDDAVGSYHGTKVVDYSNWYTGTDAATNAKNRISVIRPYSQALYSGDNSSGRYYDYNKGEIVTANGIANVSVYGQYAKANFTDAHKQGTQFWYTLRATNYEAVFRTINEDNLMKNRDNAEKVIIFLTDGDPTVTWTKIKGTTCSCSGKSRDEFDHQWNSEGFGTTYGGTDNVAACLAEALKVVDDVEMDRFYAIGFGDVTSGNLKKLVDAATQTSYADFFYSSTLDLTAAFSNLVNQFDVKHYSGVTVTDTLRHGENNVLKVDVVDEATIQVEVRNKNGEKIGTYENGGKKVTLPITQLNASAESGPVLTVSRVGDDLILNFPDNYILETGYTYTLSAVIRPTEQAYREWQQDGYTDTPDGGTGTHAANGQNGLFSNDRAVVTYTFGGEQGETGAATYDHPVVRLDPGKLVITKSITGLTSAQIQNLDLTFTVDLTYPDNGDELGNEERTITIRPSDMTVDENDRYSYTISGLSPNTEYTVTESFTTPTGYRATSKVNGVTGKTVSGTVPKGGTERADFVNQYVLATSTVRVEKQVSGNLSSEDKEFSFTASMEDGDVTMAGISYVKYSKNANGALIAGSKTEITTDTFSFKLKDDEYCVFYDVPLNKSMRIGEKPEDYNLVKVLDDTGKSWIIWPDKSVMFLVTAVPSDSHEYGRWFTFYNDRTVVIETGISLDSLPYILILAGVAVAGAFLVLRKSRRRYED